MKQVAYILKSVDGGWPQHSEIARGTLLAVCRALKKEIRIIDSFTTANNHYFRYPDEIPNILRLGDFFAEETDLYGKKREIDALWADSEFFNAAMAIMREGYYIARVVGDDRKKVYSCNDLTFYLKAMKEMHGTHFTVIPPDPKLEKFDPAKHDRNCLEGDCTILCPINGPEIRRIAEILRDAYEAFVKFGGAPPAHERFGHPLFCNQAKRVIAALKKSR